MNSPAIRDTLGMCAPEVVDRLSALLAAEGTVVLEARDVSMQTGLRQADVEACLHRLAEAGEVRRVEYLECSVCHTRHSAEDVIDGRCNACGAEFVDNPPNEIAAFVRDGEPTRDARWLVTVHGMNTYGQWQQDFTWLLAKAYGYSIPSFIYKYGRLLVSPFLVTRQKHYVSRLAADLRSRIEEMAGTSYGTRADVIAHSFGTLLVARVLCDNPDLKVGRVVLTGSIIPPEFDWAELMQRDQVEGVLCHSGGRDAWVRLAPYFIPGSGPSGAYGFRQTDTVRHLHSPTYAHSDFFEPDHLTEMLAGPWGSFLTTPRVETWSAPDDLSPQLRAWKRGLRHFGGQILKYVVLLGIVVLIAWVLVSVWVGSAHLATTLGWLRTSR